MNIITNIINFFIFFVFHLKLCSTLLEVTRATDRDTFSGVTPCPLVGFAWNNTQNNAESKCTCGSSNVDSFNNLFSERDGKMRCMRTSEVRSHHECRNFEVSAFANVGLQEKTFIFGRVDPFSNCDVVVPKNVTWWNYRKELNEDLGKGIWEVQEELKNKIKATNVIRHALVKTVFSQGKNLTAGTLVSGTIVTVNFTGYNLEGPMLRIKFMCQSDVGEECLMIKIPGTRQYPLLHDDLLILLPPSTKTTTKSTTKTTTTTTAMPTKNTPTQNLSLTSTTSTTTTSTTTKSPHVVTTTTLTKNKEDNNNNETLIIAILIPIILLLIIIIGVLVYYVKSKSNKKNQSAENPTAKPAVHTLTNTYLDITSKYQGKSEIYAELSNDAVVYKEVDYDKYDNPVVYREVDDNENDKNSHYETDGIENDVYYSSIA